MRQNFIHLWQIISNWYGVHITPYWSFTQLFNSTPPYRWPWMYIYLGLLIFFFLAIILIAFLHLREGLKKRFYPYLITNLVLGLVIFFFREQRVPILGMDIWRLLQELEMIIWIPFILIYILKGRPKEILGEKVEQRRQKYLPKKKNPA
jgi:hypothetical protein